MIISKVTRLLYYLVVSLFFLIHRKKNITVITGMRRSGNHAFINWFVSALENKKMTLSINDKGDEHALISETGKTIFINEANWRGYSFYFHLLLKLNQEFKKASNIIISLEDYTPNKYFDPYIPYNSKKTVITRSTLNIISSRLTRSKKQAEDGLDRGDMAINKEFINRLKWILHSSAQDGWENWNYDLWLDNINKYREHFLDKFHLTTDIHPEISFHGGGSSFSGNTKVPSTEVLKNRWKEVTLPKRVIELLLEESNRKLLSDEDITLLKSKYESNERNKT